MAVIARVFVPGADAGGEDEPPHEAIIARRSTGAKRRRDALFMAQLYSRAA
jgi:hypothetical protein